MSAVDRIEERIAALPFDQEVVVPVRELAELCREYRELEDDVVRWPEFDL